jgi:hypothetical protein
LTVDYSKAVRDFFFASGTLDRVRDQPGSGPETWKEVDEKREVVRELYTKLREQMQREVENLSGWVNAVEWRRRVRLT